MFQVLGIDNQFNIDLSYIESNVPSLVDKVKRGRAQVLGCVSCREMNRAAPRSLCCHHL